MLNESSIRRLLVWTDGSRSGYGVLIKDEEGNTLRRLAGAKPADLPDHSHTEYLAVIMALREARGIGATAVLLQSDSLFLVDQMNGRAKRRSPDMDRYHSEALAAASGMKLEVVHIAGAENPADGLSKMFADK